MSGPDKKDRSVAVVIVTFGAKEYLKNCLDSLREQDYPGMEVFVVNNSPDPGFAEKAAGYFPPAEILSYPENLFYGASLNKGISSSRSEYILCLNDDIVLEKGFISEALKGFSVDEKIGIVGGKILRPDKKTIDSTGLFLSVWRTARERGYSEIDRGRYDKPGPVFGASGAAAFLRRAMLEDIKNGKEYFDEDFRMFYEDLDLCWRARRQGWSAYYVPSARAYHVRGGSWRPDPGLGKAVARRYLSDELHAELIRNRYRAVIKNENISGLAAHLIPMLAYDLCAWLYMLVFRPGVLKLFFSRKSGQ